jgi:hypothetical protein
MVLQTTPSNPVCVRMQAALLQLWWRAGGGSQSALAPPACLASAFGRVQRNPLSRHPSHVLAVNCLRVRSRLRRARSKPSCGTCSSTTRTCVLRRRPCWRLPHLRGRQVRWPPSVTAATHPHGGLPLHRACAVRLAAVALAASRAAIVGCLHVLGGGGRQRWLTRTRVRTCVCVAVCCSFFQPRLNVASRGCTVPCRAKPAGRHTSLQQ